MKDERNRMKALGGRGMWFSGRFLLWDALRLRVAGAASSSSGAIKVNVVSAGGGRKQREDNGVGFQT